MSHGDTGVGAARGRVLLVDDEPWMLRVMQAVLSSRLDVDTCASGEEALRMLALQRFDVVCSDLVMPRMNGVELLEEVARRHPEVGCVLVTGSTDHLRPGAPATYEVLLKPFDPARLLLLVTRLARDAQARRGGEPL